MRTTLVSPGWLSRAIQTVPILAIAGCCWGAFTSGASAAETYYGMPVVKTVGSYKVVDVRPMLSKLRYVNAMAKSAFGVANSSTPLCDISIGGWRTLILSASERNYAGRNVPAGSTYFSFAPKVRSSMYVVGGLYYANGVWNAAGIGASRESVCKHLYDLTDGNYASAGSFFEYWHLPWPKTYPTVVVMMDYYRTVMTYGIVVNATLPAPVYPAAPANTYTLIQSTLTWSGAKADAERRGGYLATITSPTEWANVLKQVGSTLLNQNLWLGGTDEGSEGAWRWVTGEPWLYSRWTAGQPNNASYRQHYLQLWGATGSAYTWDDQDNVALPGYLLEVKGTAPPPTNNPVTPSNRVYLLVKTNLTWTLAKADAEKRGGYLATVTSSAEWTEILRQVGSANLQSKEVWLGASDAAREGTWQWITGEAWSYARWASGQPNNSGGKQHYLHLWAYTGANLQWDDMENGTLPYYLLEVQRTTRSARRPVDVRASAGEPPDDDPWSLVDQNSDTLWMGRTDAGGWWVVLAYPFPVDVTAVRLEWAEALAADRVRALWSLDAKTWTPLAEDELPILRYLWLIFEDDGSGVPPAIRSLEVK